MSYDNEEINEFGGIMASDDDGTSDVDLDEPLEPLETTESFDDYVEDDPDTGH
jgi:hypothetical protein